jgi:hypothetical protein
MLVQKGYFGELSVKMACTQKWEVQNELSKYEQFVVISNPPLGRQI